ncbi:MAG: hypothetical protein Kow0029_09940 [Candidatus Rifleibacteriota bacterium]
MADFKIFREKLQLLFDNSYFQIVVSFISLVFILIFLIFITQELRSFESYSAKKTGEIIRSILICSLGALFSATPIIEISLVRSKIVHRFRWFMLSGLLIAIIAFFVRMLI